MVRLSGPFGALLGPGLVAIFLGACDRGPSQEASSEGIRLALAGEPAELELSSGERIVLDPAVAEVYRSSGFAPLWVDGRRLSRRGERVLGALDMAEADGLDPERYRRSLLRGLAERLREGDVDGDEGWWAANLDLLLSNAFQGFASDLSRGATGPEEADLDWRIPRGEPPGPELLRRVVDGEDPRAVLAALRPAMAQYGRLSEALAHYRAVEAAGGWPELPPDARLERGDTGSVVATLRERLLAEGDPVEVRLARTGEATPRAFDDALAEAMEHFQGRHDIEPDGTVGPETLRELNTPAGKRVQEIRLNLDRWRWLPGELGERYIMVNVAGFELEVVEGDSVVLDMNVVVGQDAWRTPIFSDTLEYLVVNPYWNVPASIADEEILPSVRRDPSYVARNAYEVVDRRGSAPRVVDARSIDWGSIQSMGSVPFDFRQTPGSHNALGRIKFMFPNDMNIYLHDTPAGHLFSRTQRAFSHGCIRVEKPVELAELIMERAGAASPDRIGELLASGEQDAHLGLEEPFPIYILYFTAWPDLDGGVRFHQDIYRLDDRIEDRSNEELAAPGDGDVANGPRGGSVATP